MPKKIEKTDEPHDPAAAINEAKTVAELVAAIQGITGDERRACGEAIAAAKKRVK